jgi:hypothetical protein
MTSVARRLLGWTSMISVVDLRLAFGFVGRLLDSAFVGSLLAWVRGGAGR